MPRAAYVHFTQQRDDPRRAVRAEPRRAFPTSAARRSSATCRATSSGGSDRRVARSPSSTPARRRTSGRAASSWSSRARTSSAQGRARTCRTSSSTAASPRPTRSSTRRRRSASTSCATSLAWLKALGGLDAIEARNARRRRRSTARIDAHSRLLQLPRGAGEPVDHERRLPPADARRSRRSSSREAKERGMVGLKGHRSVGGIRVSLYNAVEPEWVRALAEFLGRVRAHQRLTSRVASEAVCSCEPARTPISCRRPCAT